MERMFARFGQGRWTAPEEGFCLSSFILAAKDDALLLGKVSDPDTWGNKWALPTWNPPRWQDKLLLPAAHLLLKEHPDQAADRIMKEMLQVSDYTLTFRGIQSHVSGEKGHWDICFIYDASIKSEIKKPKWFFELRYVKIKDIKPDEVGRGHADIISEAGISIRRQ